MKALKIMGFISVFALLLSSCSNITSLGCPDAVIEWADVLMIDDIEYHHDFPDPTNEDLPITIEKGNELGKVTYKMADRACSNHKMRNGDAAFLNAGTPIYEIKGYPTSLIVSADDHVYVVHTNEKAKTAGELFPMNKLVKNIYIESTEDGKRIHTFTQSSKDKFLAEFQELKLEDVLSLDNEGKFEGTHIFLGIELNNGVSFRQSYWLDSNTFINGAIGNDEIKEVIIDEFSNLKN
ncbi:hypothetical protein JSQ81_12160 [Sporosarcina sp. Marseille-Q4063]|uniref:hypothetical protein n=1 Tax=Sporosarcina sp. Marseille-Q4063 TaxID=2810514 RepID=UPI001BB0A38E|nr:hypothetical protein [Sporosarcina sp. Marseille-Q4063]QUW20607.1 hypothetical protein JSQ81_12160 [Sporosarcina sp. Marseille-Q4063]